MFEIVEWDGLAKIGEYTTNNKTIKTPALFPVVDPKQQSTPIKNMKNKFGFDQVITSAYLMSKRMGHTNWQEYPDIRSYLDYDGMVMMDSGAYQVMLYGDIELGVEETIDLQSHVLPDIGVLMDHPIGYDVSYPEAKKRVESTIENVKRSIPLLDPKINWTLPIQGGRYLDLLESYLQEMTKPEIIDHFNFYALGSVVPVMINQNYTTLVEMISLTRQYLPTDRPLHLFGAGHPAMFALATFLGCDTFDSAAYILMAKDNRYMTVDGTYQLEDLVELPCHCEVCLSETVDSLLAKASSDRMNLLAEHNLAVSTGEIKTIRQAIRDGTLWDLVMKRSNAVPNLALATRRAIEMVTSGRLQSKFEMGVPVSKSTMQRITRSIDLEKPLIRRHRQRGFESLLSTSSDQLVCLAFPMYRSIYNRLPDDQINNYDPNKVTPVVLLPPVGLLPLGASELFPIGQMINEINVNELSTLHIVDQLRSLQDKGKKITIYYTDEEMNTYLSKLGAQFDDITIEKTTSALTQFNTHVEQFNEVN